MEKLFCDMPNMKVYIDDLLIFSNGSYEDHLATVKEALDRLHQKNMAVNAEKSFWAVREVDYLGFRLTPEGVLPQPKKVAAIKNMQPPTNKRQLRGFIGLVNFYRYMWKRRSHILEPLTTMSGKNTHFKWTSECQAAFDEMKRAISEEVLLAFPDYNSPLSCIPMPLIVKSELS